MGLLLLLGSQTPAALAESQRYLKKHVKALTDIAPPRNYFYVESLDKAAAYIGDYFKSLGLQTEYQEFNVEGRVYKNVRAFYGPPSDQRIIIGAHYDVCGHQPGADDNASGIAGLLETARLLTEKKPAITHLIEFVAYTLEEPPYFRTDHMGSAVHAKQLHDAGLKVKSVVVLEMIGYFLTDKNTQKYPLGFMRYIYSSRGNYIGVVGNLKSFKLARTIKKTIQKKSSIPAVYLSAPSIVPGVDYSDHRSYWPYGIPAVMVTDTAFYRNPHYHQPSDTPGTLNYTAMTKVVHGVYHALCELASEKRNPKK